MKYSLVAGIVRWSGGQMTLTRGMSADDDHPLVVERPDLFGEEPPEAHLAAPAPAVERATAAPGEKRTTPGSGPRKAAQKGGTGE